MKMRRTFSLAVLLIVAGTLSTTAGSGESFRVTHGVSAGDVTANSAVIWSRGSGNSRMVVEYTSVTEPMWPPLRRGGASANASSDFTGKVLLDGLSPDTRYLYWVRFTAADGTEVHSETGQFRTAPTDDALRPLSLVWWGDVGGQGYCRDPERGYSIFTQMARLNPDIAVANGDSLYVDGRCLPVTTLPDHPRNALSTDPGVAAHQLVPATDPRWKTPEEVLGAFRAKWKYNLEDEPYRRFRAQTPHYFQWDDHEVINDWYPGEGLIGALRGTRDPRPISALIAPGRQTFFEFTPTRPDAAGRIYRGFRFGKLAELFLMDGRSYRDDNILPDGVDKVLDVRLENGERRRLVGKQKTMLGREQREWLLAGLKDAQARGVVWKIISIDDPLSSPSGSYRLFTPDGPMTPLYTVRDGWATGTKLNTDTDGNQDNPLGFESELRAILGFLKAENISNVVWLATDVHYARLLRYEPTGPLAGLVFHEFISGPANAGTFVPRAASTTFGPVELYVRGRRPDPARPSFFNFGALRIAADGALTVEIRDADGAIPTDDQGRRGTLALTPAR